MITTLRGLEMMDQKQRQVSLHDMPHPERLIVWAMRVWVVGVRERISVDEVLRGAFARAGASRALPVLDNVMAVIAGGAARIIDVACVCHEEISADERTLLDVIALFQAGDTLETPLMLRSFLTPQAAMSVAPLIEHLATALSDARFVLRNRPSSARRHAISAGHGAVGWAGSATIH